MVRFSTRAIFGHQDRQSDITCELFWPQKRAFSAFVPSQPGLLTSCRDKRFGLPTYAIFGPRDRRSVEIRQFGLPTYASFGPRDRRRVEIRLFLAIAPTCLVFLDPPYGRAKDAPRFYVPSLFVVSGRREAAESCCW